MTSYVNDVIIKHGKQSSTPFSNKFMQKERIKNGGKNMADQNPLVRKFEAINNVGLKDVHFVGPVIGSEILDDLNEQEDAFLKELPNLAIKANRWAGIAKATFTFGWGQERVRAYGDNASGTQDEFVTRDGAWQKYDGGVTTEVQCTPEAIFEMLKVQYLVDKGIVDRYSNDLMSLFEIKIQRKAYVADDFIAFLKRTEEALAKRKRTTMREEGLI